MGRFKNCKNVVKYFIYILFNILQSHQQLSSAHHQSTFASIPFLPPSISVLPPSIPVLPPSISNSIICIFSKIEDGGGGRTGILGGRTGILGGKTGIFRGRKGVLAEVLLR